ncbi:MAG: hypothetical protein ACKV2V_00760 [Blastocatellia bacterium]
MNRYWLGFELSVLRRVKFNSVAIPFSGQPDVDWYLKYWHKQVFNNDICQWSWWISRALVENQGETLGDEDTTRVLRDAYVPRRQHHNPALAGLMGEMDSWWFDNVWRNIQDLPDTTKQALATQVALSVGDYTHSFTPETAYLKRPLSEVFDDIRLTQRRAYNNGLDNRCGNLDAVDFIRQTRTDLMYARFPGPRGLAELKNGIVGWRETWVRGTDQFWPDLIASRRGSPGDVTGSKEQYRTLLSQFLESARHLPKWAISHAEDGFFSAAEIGDVIKQFRPVEVAYNKDFTEFSGGLNSFLIIA